MKNDPAQKKRDILNEVIGPTIKYGKHSSYHKKGKNKIIILTRKDDEELPSDVTVANGTRNVIFEDSKGNIKLSYELYDDSSYWKPKKTDFGSPDWG